MKELKEEQKCKDEGKNFTPKKWTKMTLYEV
jgi:hypothetical protein